MQLSRLVLAESLAMVMMRREVLSLQDLARQGRDQRSYGDEEIESADQSFFLAPRGTRKLQLRQEAQNLVMLADRCWS